MNYPKELMVECWLTEEQIRHAFINMIDRGIPARKAAEILELVLRNILEGIQGIKEA